MSMWIYLNDPSTLRTQPCSVCDGTMQFHEDPCVCCKDGTEETIDACEVDRHSGGGTFVLGGTRRAELNVTYNYQKFYVDHIGKRGLWELDNRTAKDTIPGLSACVTALGTKRDDDYWEATPGNAGHAASILLGWAQQHPNGVWIVSG